MQHMNLLDAMNLTPERSPVEASPMPVLQVNQNCQDEKHYDTGQNSLFIHERPSKRRIPRRAPKQNEAGDGCSKVNDQAEGVNRSVAQASVARALLPAAFDFDGV
jgi:hypothetical protein